MCSVLLHDALLGVNLLARDKIFIILCVQQMHAHGSSGLQFSTHPQVPLRSLVLELFVSQASHPIILSLRAAFRRVPQQILHVGDRVLQLGHVFEALLLGQWVRYVVLQVMTE